MHVLESCLSMNVSNINLTDFRARIQFDNKKQSGLPQKNICTCQRTYIKAKHILAIPLFFSAVLSKIIKIKNSVKLPS